MDAERLAAIRKVLTLWLREGEHVKPQTVSDLLDHIDALQAENERLQGLVRLHDGELAGKDFAAWRRKIAEELRGRVR